MAEPESETPSDSVASPSDGNVRNADPPAPPASNVVDVAVKFLQNPNVRASPLAQKKAFLKRKGLNDEQISLALERSGTPAEDNTLVPSGIGSHQHVGPTTSGPQQFNVPQSNGHPWRVYATLTAAAGVAGYGLYHFYKLYMQPLFHQREQDVARVQRLEATVDSVQTNLNTTVGGVQGSIQSVQDLLEHQQKQLETMQEELSRLRTSDPGLSEVKTELSTLKGLLLSRHQFPSFPSQRPSIPAWQRAEPSTSAASTASPGRLQNHALNGDSSANGALSSDDQEKNNGAHPLNGGNDCQMNGAVEPNPDTEDDTEKSHKQQKIDSTLSLQPVND